MKDMFNDSQRTELLSLTCFSVSILAMAMILVALPYKINILVSVGTYVIAFCAMLLLVQYLFDHFDPLPLPAGWFLLLVIITVLAALCTTPTGIGQRLVKSICFFEIPIFMLGYDQKLKRQFLPVVFWVQYALSWFFLYLSTTNKAYYFFGEYGEAIVEHLTLGYNNPNETAIYLFLCVIVLCASALYFKSIVLKCLFLTNAVLVFRLIVLTESRAGMLVVLFSSLSFVLVKKLSVKRGYIKIAMAIPLALVLIIVIYHDSLVNLQLWGDSLETGRLDVFNHVFSDLQLSEIFLGDFATHSFGNLHNIYISIFGTIGIFGLIAFVICLYTILVRCCPDKNDTLLKKYGFVNILLLIIYSSVEAALLAAGSAFAVGFVCVYSIAVAEDE